jgi:hypothetical protein
MSDDLEQQHAQHIAQIDRTIHEAVLFAVRWYLAGGVALDQLPDRLHPFCRQLARIRAEAVAKLEAYTLRLRAVYQQRTGEAGQAGPGVTLH